jgi:predicted PurR-regulated permease PerM
MKLKEKLIFSVVAVLIFIWLIYLAKAILTPFVFSLTVSYFLNPVVDRFTKENRMSRLKATTLILGLFFAIFISLSLILLPTIYAQLTSLIETLPSYFKIFATNFYPKISELINKAGFDIEANFSNLAQQQGVASKVFNFSTDILNNAISSTIVIINVLALLFVTPFLIFYLLKDWDIMIEKVNGYLPRQSSSLLRKIFKEIDATLSGYVRGQINVCLILGAIYSVLLSCTDLNFGFIIGFLTGLLVFIPYIGMLIGIITATVVGLFQWGFDIYQISIISSIFLFGQVIESNFLTPKLIGSKIGIHPVWMIFGLFFFGNLLGFIGVFIAVPLTAICGVIIRQLALEYRRRFNNAS